MAATTKTGKIARAMTTAYSRILFNREDLFTVCKFGVIAQQIGSLWCVGHIPSDRIDKLKECVQIREL